MTTNDSFNIEPPVCPHCHASHASASPCVSVATQTTSGPLVAQAESLFESYLAARLVRSRRNLTVAKVALLRDPRSSEKRDALLRTEAETQTLQTQLLEQARRTAPARERAKIAAHLESLSAESASATSARATDDFRTLQAAKADNTVRSNASDGRSRPDDRECPRCGDRMSADHTVCRCGHRFTAGNKSRAEPFLSDEEAAALRPPKFTE
jgi:hypothetical protein